MTKTAERTIWGEATEQKGSVDVSGETLSASINDTSYGRLRSARKAATEKLSAAVRPSVEENRSPTEAEVAQYDEATAELALADEQIDRIKAVADAETRLAGMDEEWSPILAASRATGGDGAATSDYQSILKVARGDIKEHGLNLTAAAAAHMAQVRGASGKDWLPAVIEARAEMAPDPIHARRVADRHMLLAAKDAERMLLDLDKATTGAGAEYVPTLMASEIFAALIDYQGIMSAGPRIIVTETGLNFDLPIWTQSTAADDVGAITADGANYDAAEPTTAEVTMGAQNYTGFVQIEENWLADVGAVIGGLDAWLTEAMTFAVAVPFDVDLTTGDGVGNAQGVVHGATAGVQNVDKTPATAPWTPAQVMELIYSIADVYADENLRLLCRRATRQFFLGARQQATSAVYPFLMSAAGQAEDRQTIMGVRLHNAPNVVAVGTNNKPAVLANLARGYAVRIVGGNSVAGGIQIRRGENDTDFRTGHVSLRGKLRADGRYLDTNAGKFLDTEA